MDGSSRASASYRLPDNTEILIGVARADVVWSGVSEGYPPRLIAYWVSQLNCLRWDSRLALALQVASDRAGRGSG